MTKRSLKAGILAIGNEVIDGHVLDTNSNWMEKQLVSLGVEMRRLVTVRDEKDEIGKSLRFLMDECDVIITSGGLGPTHDDMTLTSIAAELNLGMELNEKGLEIVKRQYKLLHEKGIVASEGITKERKKMAIIPKTSKPLDNRVGGAPGVRIDFQGKTIFCLPGVPSELKDIWDRSVHQWISSHIRGAYYEEVVEFEVVDESVFAPYIATSMAQNPGTWIKSMPKRYGTTRIMRVWVSARDEEVGDAKRKVRTAIKTLERVSGLQSWVSNQE